MSSGDMDDGVLELEILLFRASTESWLTITERVWPLLFPDTVRGREDAVLEIVVTEYPGWRLSHWFVRMPDPVQEEQE